MLIELSEGIFIAPEHVTLVRSTEENRCAVFFVGQSALDGHLIDYSADEVAEAINDALADEFEEGEEDESEESE